MRAFIAIPLPPSVRQALAGLAAELARVWDEGAVRWIPTDNIHLTLRFLDETDEELVPALARILDELAAGHCAFPLTLQGTGAFPNPRRARVIWAGLGDPQQGLPLLKKELDRALRPLGWERETKPFRPHLTVGRVKQREASPAGPWLVDPPALDFSADAVELIENTLRPTGAEYRVLRRVVLADAAG